MKDLIKRSFLLGLGAASMTRQQAGKIVDELVKKNAITINEGKDILRKVGKVAQNEQKRIARFAAKEAKRIAKSIGSVPKPQVDKARTKLQAINNELSSRGKKVLRDALKYLSR